MTQLVPSAWPAQAALGTGVGGTVDGGVGPPVGAIVGADVGVPVPVIQAGQGVVPIVPVAGMGAFGLVI